MYYDETPISWDITWYKPYNYDFLSTYIHGPLL